MTTVTPEIGITGLVDVLERSSGGQEILARAVLAAATGNVPKPTIHSAAEVAERSAIRATLVTVSNRARAKLREVGPAGTRGGPFLFELARDTGVTYEQAFKVMTSLETVGLIELEGSSTFVSTELDPPVPDRDPANWTEVPERDPCRLAFLYDDTPPPAAKASTPTLSDQ